MCHVLFLFCVFCSALVVVYSVYFSFFLFLVFFVFFVFLVVFLYFLTGAREGPGKVQGGLGRSGKLSKTLFFRLNALCTQKKERSGKVREGPGGANQKYKKNPKIQKIKNIQKNNRVS